MSKKKKIVSKAKILVWNKIIPNKVTVCGISEYLQWHLCFSWALIIIGSLFEKINSLFFANFNSYSFNLNKFSLTESPATSVFSHAGGSYFPIINTDQRIMFIIFKKSIFLYFNLWIWFKKKQNTVAIKKFPNSSIETNIAIIIDYY